jgi:hypothetical protein
MEHFLFLRHVLNRCADKVLENTLIFHVGHDCPQEQKFPFHYFDWKQKEFNLFRSKLKKIGVIYLQIYHEEHSYSMMVDFSDNAGRIAALDSSGLSHFPGMTMTLGSFSALQEFVDVVFSPENPIEVSN